MEPGRVILFTSSVTPRLNYIAELIFGEILGLTWGITTDKRKFGKNIIINYTSGTIDGSFTISPAPLLFEDNVHPIDIFITKWNDLPVFFQTSSDSDLPFDIFAASFFLVARYEEYLEFSPDEYGRFTASESLALRNGFLKKPIVDLWIREFAIVLVKRYNNLTFKSHEFNPIVAIDIDKINTLQKKKIIGNISDIIKDLAKKKNKESEKIYRQEIDNDPFTLIKYITGNIENTNTEARFFFSMCGRTELEKNPSFKDPEYKRLIGLISEKYMTGIRISFKASADKFHAIKEISRLRLITGQDVTLNHYSMLRIVMPDSYRNLLGTEIHEDYSMGYENIAGFRAGISRPFRFYDIREEAATSLRIIPFQIMDTCLKVNGQFALKAPRLAITEMIDETKKAGGLFVSLWHLSSFISDTYSNVQRDLFEFTLKSQGLL